ncbi:MAG: hypothetical protein RMJ44_11255, partial [Cytophagales bacterium]|nr:hypothetical protein [Cytophagales bacterium]
MLAEKAIQFFSPKSSRKVDLERLLFRVNYGCSWGHQQRQALFVKTQTTAVFFLPLRVSSRATKTPTMAKVVRGDTNNGGFEGT